MSGDARLRLRLRRALAGAGLACLLLGGAGALWGEPAAPAPTWREVGPLLERACAHCHGGDRPVAGLSLDTRALALQGGASGPAIVAQDPAASRIVKHLRGTLEPRMPFDGDALPEEQIRLIEAWIEAGAPDAPPVPPAPPAPPVPPDNAQPPAPAAPAAPAPGAAPPAAPDAPLRYDAIAPILRRACVRCHQERGLRGPPPEGLRLGDLASVLRGGERVVVLPGNPQASPLTRAVRGAAHKRMPLDGPPWLPEADMLALERWIRDGARDADGTPAPQPVGRRLRLVGTWQDGDRLDGLRLVRAAGARVDDDVRSGQRVEARLVVGAAGELRIERVRAR